MRRSRSSLSLDEERTCGVFERLCSFRRGVRVRVRCSWLSGHELSLCETASSRGMARGCRFGVDLSGRLRSRIRCEVLQVT